MLLESVEATRWVRVGTVSTPSKRPWPGLRIAFVHHGVSEVRLPTINIDYSKATSSVLSANFFVQNGVTSPLNSHPADALLLLARRLSIQLV